MKKQEGAYQNDGLRPKAIQRDDNNQQYANQIENTVQEGSYVQNEEIDPVYMKIDLETNQEAEFGKPFTVNVKCIVQLP